MRRTFIVGFQPNLRPTIIIRCWLAGCSNRDRSDRVGTCANVLSFPSGRASGRIRAGLKYGAITFDRDGRHSTARVAGRDSNIDRAVGGAGIVTDTGAD